jgi:hypothetical protein
MLYFALITDILFSKQITRLVLNKFQGCSTITTQIINEKSSNAAKLANASVIRLREPFYMLKCYISMKSTLHLINIIVTIMVNGLVESCHLNDGIYWPDNLGQF